MIPGIVGAAGNLIGGLMNNSNNNKNNQANLNWEKEYAQNEETWKIQQGLQYGISPLASIGAPSSPASAVYQDDDSLGNSIGAMGQDISRAAMAPEPSSNKHDQIMDAITERHGNLENEILKHQLANISSTQNPGIPPLNNNFSSGSGSDKTITPMPASGVDSSLFSGAGLLYSLNHSLLPLLGINQPQMPSNMPKAEPGYHWDFNGYEWTQRKDFNVDKYISTLSTGY